jgi:RNA polymerase sigma factor (sigma-70 family)
VTPTPASTSPRPGRGATAAGAAADDDRLDLADPTAFGRWYAERWEPTWRLACRLVGDRTAAEDIAAEVLTTVWARWRRAGVPERPTAYLAMAVRNRVASHQRRAARDRAVRPTLAGPLATEGPEEASVAKAEVAQLLSHLGEDEREAFALYYLDDLPCAEIADRLGLQPASVRSRLHRGRRRLVASFAA